LWQLIVWGTPDLISTARDAGSEYQEACQCPREHSDRSVSDARHR
jgi:hypothetical protein